MTVGFRVRFEFGLGRGANVRGGGQMTCVGPGECRVTSALIDVVSERTERMRDRRQHCHRAAQRQTDRQRQTR